MALLAYPRLLAVAALALALTVTPAPAAASTLPIGTACSPSARPYVATTTYPVKPRIGRLVSTVSVTNPANRILAIRVGQVQNATVFVPPPDWAGAPPVAGQPTPGSPLASGQRYVPSSPPNHAVVLVVDIQQPLGAIMVPLVVETVCGDWPTFVGAGPGALWGVR